MGSSNYSQAIRPDIAYIRKIIESSLLAEWAIRIEYLGAGQDHSSWQSWEKPFFAIRSSKPVLEALLECYTKHPRSIIRISAEKFRPQTRMLYTVYNPGYLPAETSSPRTFRGYSSWEQDWSYAQTGIAAG